MPEHWWRRSGARGGTGERTDAPRLLALHAHHDLGVRLIRGNRAIDGERVEIVGECNELLGNTARSGVDGAVECRLANLELAPRGDGARAEQASEQGSVEVHGWTHMDLDVHVGAAEITSGQRMSHEPRERVHLALSVSAD